MRTVFLLIAAISFSFVGHKFYVSTTTVHHNSIASTLEITMKIYSDDLERAVRPNAETPVYLGDEKEHRDTNFWIEEYLRSKFEILIDERTVSWIMIGKEVDYDLTYCYLEIQGVQGFNLMTIRNEVLMDIFEEQANIVDIDYGGWQKKILLSRDRPLEHISP